MTQASSQANAVSKVVRDALGVNPAYRHVPKRVTAGQPVTLSLALLKWYELFPVDRPVPEEISRAARRAVESDVKVEGLGFVVLHRCGGDFYFLITNTWRNENELWETVWYKDGDAMAEFAPFPRHLPHLPTYCVWELVPVWKEKEAWERFLETDRGEAAASRWLGEVYEGSA